MSTFAVTGARIFDGDTVRGTGTVVVTDGVVTDVGTDAAVPGDATVVDGSGATLLPGLIDAHVHLSGRRISTRSPRTG